jgi:hypothetical protein
MHIVARRRVIAVNYYVYQKWGSTVHTPVNLMNMGTAHRPGINLEHSGLYGAGINLDHSGLLQFNLKIINSCKPTQLWSTFSETRKLSASNLLKVQSTFSGVHELSATY